MLLWCRKGVLKYFPGFSGAGEVYLNTSPALSIYIYLSDSSPAPKKPGKYLKTPFRRRRSISTHFSGAGEALRPIYTYLAPERSEKPEKYLYTLTCTAVGKVQVAQLRFRVHLEYIMFSFCNSRCFCGLLGISCENMKWLIVYYVWNWYYENDWYYYENDNCFKWINGCFNIVGTSYRVHQSHWGLVLLIFCRNYWVVTRLTKDLNGYWKVLYMYYTRALWM